MKKDFYKQILNLNHIYDPKRVDDNQLQFLHKRNLNHMQLNISKNKKTINIIFFLSYIFLIFLSIENCDQRILNKESSITLRIHKSGVSRIFFKGYVQDLCDGGANLPKQLTINTIDPFNYPDIPDEYEFTSENNVITLIFEDPITNCNCLFYGCSNIDEIDLSNFNTAEVNTMASMFRECLSLTSITFGNNFITSNVGSMRFMFQNCSSITSLDLSIFNTRSVTDIAYMFYGCKQLSFINLKSFETSGVCGMDRIFTECSSLTELDITNFRTSNANWMSEMFFRCTSLKSLDLSNFDTSSVSYMDGMFNECTSLISLDLKNFNTANVQYFGWMFTNCHSLVSLDISSFNTERAIDMRIMFGVCRSLTELDISNFNTPLVEDLGWMFHDCKNLTSIKLPNLKTSNAKDMEYMFHGCSKLKTLDVSHFQTSKVITISHIFCFCQSLISLDISNFDTSQVTDMQGMFVGCQSLKELNLANFNTQKVLNISHMFEGCSSLETLDISNFVTSEVLTMALMFCGCNNLKSLNLNHFDTSKVTNMANMFNGCYNLEFLYINNFNTGEVENMEGMFYECYKLKNLEITNFSTSKVKTMAAMFVRCTTLTSLDLSSFNTSAVTEVFHMFEDCQSLESLDISHFVTSNIETMHAMFLRCKKLSSLHLSNYDTSHVTDIQYMFSDCPSLKFIDLKNSIINNNISTYKIIDQTLINPIICIDDINTLNKVISEYECFYNFNCSNDLGENNKCINGCLLSKTDPNRLCYQICSYYFYFDKNMNKYVCTENMECPQPYIKSVHDTKECVKSCEDTEEDIFEYNNICLKSCPENFVALKEKANQCTPACPKEKPFLYLDSLKCTQNCTIKERQSMLCITNYISTKDDNFNIFDIVISQVRHEIENNFDKTVVNGNPIKERGATIKIIRTGQDSDDDNVINLGECEDKLKEHYNISDALYLLRIDVEQLGSAVGSFEYEVYYPIEDNNNLVKLNLSICKDIKIDVVIPVNISDDVEKHNPNSPYYNDICYITDSDGDKDITLSDRKEDFVNNNMSLCEHGCDFVSYNSLTQKAVCSCGIKAEIPFMDNVKFDKSVLMSGFTDISNIANIKLMTCYKTIFQKKYILKNIGNYIFSILFILNLICFLLFIIKYYGKFIKTIKNIKFNNLKKVNNIISINRLITKKNDRKNKNKFIRHSPPKYKRKIKLNNNNKFSKTFIKKNNKNALKRDNKRNLILMLNNNINHNKKKQTLIKKNIILKLNHKELNTLKYKEALIRDKRTYIQYYISLLQINHILLFIFYNKDYNSGIIKISIFLFNLASYISVNALFFNDDTMHKIYTNDGSYNIIYQLPQIIYSAIISAVLNIMIKLLGLSESNVLKYKKINFKIKNKDNEFKRLITILKIKFTFFYVCLFIFLAMFWYYVTCFCGMYRNTQLHLIKDSLFSFATSLISPLVIYLMPGIFRICGLKYKKKIMYKISKLLQMI